MAPAVTRWDIVLLAFAAGVAGIFQTAKMGIVLPAVQEAIGLSLTGASWSTTAISLVGVLFGVQAGRIAGDFGVARTMIAALLISALAGAAAAAIGNASVFLAIRVVEGLGYLLICAAAPPLMAAYATPRDQRVALALWGAFVPVGVSLMALVGPSLAVALGWRGLFFVSAACPLFIAAALLVRVKEKEARNGSGLAILRAMPTDAAFLYGKLSSLGLGVAFMAFAAMQVGLLILLPTFLTEEVKMEAPVAGALLSITAMAAILGSLSAGVLTRFLASGQTIIMLSFLLMGLAASALFLAEMGTVLLGLSSAVFFAASGVVASLLLASLPHRAASAASFALLAGLIVQFGNIGALIGAPVLAIFAETWSWRLVPLALIAFTILGIAAAHFGKPPTDGKAGGEGDQKIRP